MCETNGFIGKSAGGNDDAGGRVATRCHAEQFADGFHADLAGLPMFALHEGPLPIGIKVEVDAAVAAGVAGVLHVIALATKRLDDELLK